jgi:hypothetical protein
MQSESLWIPFILDVDLTSKLSFMMELKFGRSDLQTIHLRLVCRRTVHRYQSDQPG